MDHDLELLKELKRIELLLKAIELENDETNEVVFEDTERLF